MQTDWRSWGGTLSANHQVVHVDRREEIGQLLSLSETSPKLAVGCGRSYGDVGLNPGGTLIDCRGLDRFIAFDRENGKLTCESGVRLADILAVICRPERDGGGWFLPVSPGTRFVTLGGAIANDIHGKNHHQFGTIGRHIISIELARSDGSRLICSATQNSGIFAATIGGLGLTGVILSATVQLRRVPGLALEVEDLRFNSLADFFALSADSDSAWEYTAAWIDCTAIGSACGRGIYSRARHAARIAADPPPGEPRIIVPLTPRISVVNHASLRPFNAVYWRKLGLSGRQKRIGSYAPVLYPLDTIGSWNRLYGLRGFYQFQCAIPAAASRDALNELLQTISNAGDGSMLAVLKMFGPLPSPGLLSFPMAGATLALDFPNRGERTVKLLKRLEEIVMHGNGRIYPAKDSVMSAEAFRRGYPELEKFVTYRDPALSSGFARRMGIAEIPQ